VAMSPAAAATVARCTLHAATAADALANVNTLTAVFIQLPTINVTPWKLTSFGQTPAAYMQMINASTVKLRYK